MLTDILLSPYTTTLLSLLVVTKWIYNMRNSGDYGLLGGLIPRLLILIIYSYICFYNPPTNDIRLFIRSSIQLLFLDEMVNWVFSTARKGRKPREWRWSLKTK